MNVESTIHDKLVDAFSPAFLEVENESHRHSVPANSETHFKVTIVATAFDGQGLVARHRAVNGLLADELAAGVHALSIHAYTTEQWVGRGQEIPTSPPCRGGSKAG